MVDELRTKSYELKFKEIVMKNEKKGADTSLMVRGKSVPVNAGVAEPPPEKLTNKEVLETLDDHERRIDALEAEVFDKAVTEGPE